MSQAGLSSEHPSTETTGCFCLYFTGVRGKVGMWSEAVSNIEIVVDTATISPCMSLSRYNRWLRMKLTFSVPRPHSWHTSSSRLMNMRDCNLKVRQSHSPILTHRDTLPTLTHNAHAACPRGSGFQKKWPGDEHDEHCSKNNTNVTLSRRPINYNT